MVAAYPKEHNYSTFLQIFSNYLMEGGGVACPAWVVVGDYVRTDGWAVWADLHQQETAEESHPVLPLSFSDN